MARSRLSALDGSFLRVESPSAHMHVAWKGRFTPRADGREITMGMLRASIQGRLRHAERFRQKLAFPPGGLAEPVWVDDPHFAIERHVAPISVEPGELPVARFDTLCDLALSAPLPRDRPLWQVLFAPRLSDGSVGLLMKVHHAMVDGKSAVELALLLLDLTPDAIPLEPDASWKPQSSPGATRLAIEAMADNGTESLRAAMRFTRMATNPARSVRLADTLRRTALAVGEDVLRPAPSSYVNVPIGPRRTLVSHTTGIEPLLAVKKARGATLNDVALTVVAGALRELSMAAGRMPAPMKVMVPVSRREEDERASLGNRIAFVFIELPVHVARTSDRLRSIVEATTRFKREGRAGSGEALLGAIGALPDPLKNGAAKLASSPRMYNLTVSNVPGPRMPVYLLGAQLEEAVPVIPIPDGHALSIGIFTLGDRVTFSGYADPTALPQAASLPGALSAAVLDVGRLAGKKTSDTVRAA